MICGTGPTTQAVIAAVSAQTELDHAIKASRTPTSHAQYLKTASVAIEAARSARKADRQGSKHEVNT